MKVKNPDDSRYQKSRRRIFAALNELIILHSSLCIRPVELYQQAKICKATLYHHFKSVTEAFAAENQELQAEFRSNLLKTFGPPSKTTEPELSRLFTQLAIFTLRHQDFFAACFAMHCEAPINQFFQTLRPYLTATWRSFSPATDSHTFTLLVRLLIPVLQNWSDRQFDRADSDKIISQLSRSTLFFTSHLSTFHHLAELQASQPSKSSSGFQPPKAKKPQ